MEERGPALKLTPARIEVGRYCGALKFFVGVAVKCYKKATLQTLLEVFIFFPAVYLVSGGSQGRGNPITSDPLTGDEWRSMRRSLLAAGRPLTHLSKKEKLSPLLQQKAIQCGLKGIITELIVVCLSAVICDPCNISVPSLNYKVIQAWQTYVLCD